ncbi:cyclin-domain-containing protein [Stachybotrys elegans]|uniref:Cyclin-domain-containing protein n=1 Tax=Stachybotrys elegans TaxID=80388 RepID=A0A8K0WTS8_9HYPO|nr:cyclin-domain-containing protein [Stachybotrys elegans]
MASQIKRDHVSSSLPGHPLAQAPLPQPSKQQPSPPSDDFNPSSSSSAVDPTQPPPHAVPPTNSSSSLPLAESVDDNASSTTQTVIHIRDLAHVQSLARADVRAGLGAGTLNDPPLQQMKYEISGMPIGDIIEMVAALLTKITTTNDLQHDAMQRNVTHQQQASQSGDASGSASHMSSLSHSVLAFHGKNVPAITILSYLSRIHRYCPTTYEVFLSLLVYFDRMTERVNERVTRNEEARRSNAQTNDAPGQSSSSAHKRTRSNPSQGDTRMRDQGESDESADETDSDLADDDDDDDDEMDDSPDESSRSGVKIVAPPPESPLASGPATYFVVDSFNIHRLIIAGVTCASKFFSDVFYTNSRYAKVGGLPLAELNHLELQFLILNDFRLAVPVEDLEAYATMLVEFYAREVVGRAPGSRD